MRLLRIGAAVVMAAGLGLSVYGVTTPPHVQPPVPRAWQAGPATDQGLIRLSAPTRPPAGHAATVPSPAATPVRRWERSAPVRILIPALRISSLLGPARGLKPNGDVDDAPLTGPTWSQPWWYSGGAAPGQDGSAVILGHVDSALGAGRLGVFFTLGNLQPGQTVTVLQANAKATHWVVTSTRLYSDGNFPNALVYDRTGSPVLHLVTCGGDYNWQTHHYESAVVATAQLVSTS